jgi:ribose transport system permease protein
MARLLGVLTMVLMLYGVLMGASEDARALANQQTIAGRLGFYGILTVGVGVLIVSGGIDLSIGSVVGLGAVCFAKLLERRVPPVQAALLVTLGGAFIGLVHGLLVTKLRLQPFLVTLCGLFVYRGLARWVSNNSSVGLALKGGDEDYLRRIEDLRVLLVSGKPLGVPAQLVLLLLISLALAALLHFTKYGRYLYAIGANEEAARYAGIPTDRYKILAYVICSALSGLGSVLYLLESRSANPTSAGTLLELYAITGAVLGGCSLRGGEGSVVGMVLGAAALPLLRQLCTFGGVGDELEYVVIGGALLVGTITDELIRRNVIGNAVRWLRRRFAPASG